MNFRQSPIAFILNALLMLAYFCVIGSLIAWVWGGWYYGWRSLLSSFILIVGITGIKIILSNTIKNMINEQQKSKEN